MHDNRATPQPAIEPMGEVCVALTPRFASSAEPQTRLFWD
jgi:hypothetical protein